MERERSLAELIPLWRTLREDATTALVTPALDYVGGIELGSLDVRFAAEHAIAGLGEGLRTLVGSLDDECTLHFLYKVDHHVDEELREYAASCADVRDPALRAYTEGRYHFLRSLKLRRTRIYLFFSERGELRQGIGRGAPGLRPAFARRGTFTEDEHRRKLKRLGQLRDRLVGRLQNLGVPTRELTLEDFWRIHYELLNPTRACAGVRQPRVRLRDTLWDDKMIRAMGAHLAEYTEAEQLAHEDVQEYRDHFRQGAWYRRVTTLKVLPESGTPYFATEPFLTLATRDAQGADQPFPFTVTATVHINKQGAARWLLNTQHALVAGLRSALPFLQARSVEQEEADRAKQESIRGLFAELTEMSTKIASLSVSLLTEARSLDELDAQTDAARTAFSRCGNSEMLVEEYTQLPAFLSMMPGAGSYQLRKKGCTTRNAADFLPLYAPWRGTAKAPSILLTPGGDLFRFDLFDKKVTNVNAHHGIVVADTGSGKSVAMGALTLDARAAGIECILMDNGGSWKPLTQLLGGVHIAVDLKTSLSPFPGYAALVDPATSKLSNEELEGVVNFLDVCVTDRTRPPFDKVETSVVTRAVRWCYESKFRERPEERPLIGDFSDALRDYPWEHSKDREIAEDLVRRLDIFCGENALYGDFLNRPSELRFDSPVLTFDLAKVSQSPTTKSIAMATIIQAITNRAMVRRTRTLVEIDEAHEYLGADDATEKFMGRCYRVMRKYDTAMWMISQNINDFLGSRVGREAIVGNSSIRIFLRHAAGKHDSIIQHFNLSPRAAEAFKSLGFKPGFYSDFFLMYGAHTQVVRLALSGLAYWILTTDKEDKDLLARAAAKNPALEHLTLLKEMAARYPHGLVGEKQQQRAGAGTGRAA